MLINLRNALMAGKRLPYDAEVEFLESTETQWINTGVKKTSGTTIDCTFSLSNINTKAIFGARTSASELDRLMLMAIGTYFRFDARYQQRLGMPDTTSIFRFQYDGANATLTNLTTGTTNTSSTPVGDMGVLDISLFGVNTNGVVGSLMLGRMYAFKIWDNGALVRDYIPVRKGTTGYLYDRVSGKLFGNAGTGDFVVGQDVVPVEYIESTGTQWIDTGYVPNMNSVFNVTFSPNNVDFVAHPVHGNAYATTGKYVQSSYSPVTLWTGNNFNNRFFNAPVAMNGLVVGQKYHIVQSAASLLRDGVVVGSYDSSQMKAPLNEPMWLFAFMNSATTRVYGLLRMYHWNASELGISMRKMLPVRVGTDATSWEGAMMDVLTRRIYRNAGTGAFTYGNDLKYPIPAE